MLFPLNRGMIREARHGPDAALSERKDCFPLNFYVDLFLTFAKVGVCTFGGGYAMLPILQREVVEKKHWVTDEAITDYYALGQCTPGIIAVNTSVFIGHQLRKIPGGIVAALGVVFPSFVVITIIATFLANFSDYPAVQHALAGINAVVVALILSSVLKLGKTTLKNAPSLCVFLGVLVLGELAGLLDLPADSAAGSVLNLLANLHEKTGDLNKIKRFVKILAFVNSADDFTMQPQVVNGGSQLLVDLFSVEAGTPARSAIGTNALPGGMACEIEALVELKK